METTQSPRGPGGPCRFAELMKQAAQRHGLSSRQIEAAVRERFGDELATSHVTLCEWMRGRTPRRSVDVAYRIIGVELVLGLNVGDLLLELPYEAVVWPYRPMAPSGARVDGRRDQLADRYLALLDLVRRRWADAADSRQLILVSVQTEYIFGRSGRPLTTVVTQRLRAMREGAQHYVSIYAADASLYPRITALSGCLAGRSEPSASCAVRDGQLLRATELILSSPIRLGAVAEVKFELLYDVGRDPNFQYVLRQPIQELDLAVQFDSLLPRLVHRCRWRNTDLTETEAVLVSGAGGRFELSVPMPPPGGYGWRWRWREDD